MEKQNDHQVIILGGGPAGLTAAYELTKHDVKPMVFEQSNKLGGISRTETYKGFHFDMGGHRFFTKVSQIHAIWEEVLKEDFTIRTRLSRIYYNNRFFMYPLKPFNALFNLGIWQSLPGRDKLYLLANFPL
jgi:protoporphyrinogen oxidase